MRYANIFALTGAAIALVAFQPPRAVASTVSVSGTDLIFQAKPGESNTVLVDEFNFGRIGVSDSPNGPDTTTPFDPTTGSGCFPPDAFGFVFCVPVSGIKIQTTDGNDVVGLRFASFLAPVPNPFEVDLGAGQDRWLGSPGNDDVSGGDGNDRLRLSAGVDHLSGGPDFDIAEAPNPAFTGQTMIIGQGAIGGGIEGLEGSLGPDRLVGDGNDNFLNGIGGNDDITGGAGRDGFDGGPGNDILRAQDGEVDGIGCGLDNDTAIVDAIDEVGADCETVVTAGPIVVTGGAESSLMEIEVNLTVVGFEYFFTDATAPFAIADNRCSPRTDISTRCESPVEVPVIADFGPGDDTMTLTGSIAFDKLTVDGGPGTDTLVASPVARGGTGTDTIRARNCAGGECLLEGGDAGDKLFGGAGRDRLLGGPGSDTLQGGGGIDTADYSNFAADVEVSLEFGLSIEPQGQDDITDVDNLVGGFGSDVLTGNGLQNQIEGGAGEDKLAGGGDDDTLDGGPANDMINGGFASDGTDTFFGGPGVDTLSYAHLVASDVSATIGSFARIGSGPDDHPAGDIEKLVGGDGDDTLHGDVNAGGPATIEGGPGQDEVGGGAGDDSLDGGDGDDTILGGQADDGIDRFHGGPGFDSVSYVLVQDRVEATIAGFARIGGETEDNFVEADVEGLIGGSGDDLLTGSSADGELSGGPGDDNLVGAAGADVLDGGPDRDVVTYSGSRAHFVTLGDDLANDGEALEGDNVRLVEDVVGGDGDDLLIGDEEDNELTGGAGSDRLDGGEGLNKLFGGPDDDVLVGGEAGSDAMFGGAGTDTADYTASTTSVVVGPDAGPVIPCDDGEAGEDCIKDDVENLIGGSGADTLFGTSGGNTLSGNGGGDALFGFDGDDTLDGGPDGDFIEGGNGTDTVLYTDRTAAVVVDPEPGGPFAPADDGEFGEGDQVSDGTENVIGGSGDDLLTGTAVENSLVGNGGKDVLIGLGGEDVLDGGAGDDSLRSQDGGVADEDLCGAGLDDAVADLADVTISCENVSLPATPPPPPPGTPPPPPALPGVPTFPGTNRTVQPFDTTTGTQPVTVTFASVLTAGLTSLTTNLFLPQPPANFSLGTPPIEYEISTTAGFTPPVTVCINTTGITFPPGQPLALFHRENGVLVDRTSSVSPPTVCGIVNSLSPFNVFGKTRTTKIVRCLVPNLKGKTLPQSRKALKRAQCKLGKVRRAHSGKVRTGRVVSQQPRPRTKARRNATVAVVVSRGPRR